jgi:hypothetical protein
MAASYVFKSILTNVEEFFRKITDADGQTSPFFERMPYLDYSSGWLYGLGGCGCFWLALLGVVLLAVAYVITAFILSDFEQVSLRKLFRGGVRAQLIAFVASYVVFLLLALAETVNYHREFQRLEAHFGRPLTSAELARDFYDGRTASPDFWQRFQENMDVFEAGDKDVFSAQLAGEPFGIVPEDVYAEWKKVFYARKGREEMERLFSSPLLPPKRDYLEEQWLYNIELPELNSCKSFSIMEMQHLRFVLDAKDMDTACNVMERLDNILRYMLRDHWLISELLCFKIGEKRLKALEKILESGLASDEWLKGQAKILTEMEEEILRSEKRFLHGETVGIFNAMHSLFHGRDIWGEPSLHFYSLRFFFPQGWFCAAYNMKRLANFLQVEHFSQIPTSDEVTRYRLVDPWIFNLGENGRKYQNFIASIRILRCLIAAELHYRQTGSYEIPMDKLLVDPFSRQFLKYKVGSCLIEKYIYQKKILEDEKQQADGGYEEVHFVAEKATVIAMQVWSVGPDGVDDGGLSRNGGFVFEGKWFMDDIRFILPIP